MSVRTDADTVTITVADRGPGLPDGDVFEAFYTTKSSGTGLGLWLVRRVVEDAGGSIAAGGRRGGGAVFTVRMPLPRHDAAAGRPHPPPRGRRAAAPRDHARPSRAAVRE